MFNSTHYVPLLRWKRGEYVALRELYDQDRRLITPLVGFLPGTWPGTDKFCREVDRSWGRVPLLVDFESSTASSRVDLTDLLERASSQDLQLIPVTGLDRSESYQQAVRAGAAVTGKVCLRLEPKQLEREGLTDRLATLVRHLSVNRGQVYLVIDFGYLPANDRRFPNDAARFMSKFPNWSEWGSIALVGGAFPLNLTEFSPGQHLHPRRDWIAWKQFVSQLADDARWPAYGDYGTLHPVFSPPPRWANFSASIRYTSDDDWVVMRGEGVFSPDSAGFEQWPANAMLLCERGEFCGGDFSYGDSYIAEIARNQEPTGNAETWLRAGLNHHLTFAARQVASFVAS